MTTYGKVKKIYFLKVSRKMNLSLTTPDGKSQEISFSDLLTKSKWTVLYFYPKDATPGCTIEARDFTIMHKDFLKLGAQVIGVSKDAEKSHCSFIEKEGLSFSLISDKDLELHEKFGTWGEKSMYGKKYMGTTRSSFILDQKGTILHERRNVKVPGHVQEILQTLSKITT
ncbi:MAG TPA: peroxiredoxin [Candidatus Absconditabacterales bacterium]|nr:peroxiredoxin [Candidatus Absconditabacterales bacterium]